MNGFDQIKAFYSWVFNNPDKIRPTHISLYIFLLNQNNRSMWVEWFKCPYDLAMQGACIGNKNTYYKCLDELQMYNLIQYKKGINNYKAPLIKLIQLYDSGQLTEQVTVPQSEQVTVPQTEPLSVLLNKNIYKLITSNIETINLKEYEFEVFINSMKTKKNNIHTSFAHLKITNDEFDKLLNLGYTEFDIINIFEKIENYKQNTKYKSLYLTSKNWLEKEKSSAKKEKETEPIVIGRQSMSTVQKNMDMSGVVNPWLEKE